MSAADAVTAAGVAAPRRRSRLSLVIVTGHDEKCDACGTQLLQGTEAALWFGRTKVHVGCALDPGSPKGGV